MDRNPLVADSSADGRPAEAGGVESGSNLSAPKGSAATDDDPVWW
jgi:hypothetical protein